MTADAAYAILTSDSHSTSGKFFIDENVLRETGIVDFEPYAMTPGGPLHTDMFLD